MQLKWIVIACKMYLFRRKKKKTFSLITISILGVGSTIPTASGECPKIEWTPAMDQYFIELMLDNLRKGNKSKNTFNKQAWNDMLGSFNAKFCFQYGKGFLRRRYRKLLKHYSDVDRKSVV